MTTPQTDLTQAVRDALQPAVDKFFDELDKRLAVEEPTPAAGGVATMHWAGASTQHAPTRDELAAFEIDDPSRPPEPDWNIVDSQPPPEPPEDAPPEALQEWAFATAFWERLREREMQVYSVWDAWLFHQEGAKENWRAANTYQIYDGFGLWADLDGELLFEVLLSRRGVSERPKQYYCPPNADCLPSDWWYGHSPVVVIDGTPTATNPTMGSATWTGFARGVVEAGTPVDGYARLEADLLAGLIDVHLTKLGGEDYSWTGLVIAVFDTPVNIVICGSRD